MSELRELYGQLIRDHSSGPRNYGRLPDPTGYAVGFNPLCGDKLALYVKVVDGVVEAASFVGEGCSISTASASLLTEAVTGRPVAEVQALFETFHDVCTGQAPEEDLLALGKLGAFAGVAEFPARVKCATLSWHALRNALRGTGEAAKTE